MPESTIHSSLEAPLMAALNALAKELLDVELMLIYPTASGWAEARPGKRGQTPEFCKVVCSSPDGARHCKMCHILMSVAAASEGVCEQICHAGASVIVSPLRTEGSETHAVLSSCLFSGEDAIEAVRARAQKLGIAPKPMIAAFRQLNTLDDKQMHVAKKIMLLAAEIGQTMISQLLLRRQLEDLACHHDAPSAAAVALEEAILTPVTSDTNGRKAQPSKAAYTMRIIADLIERRPYLPFSVKELAGSARMTRNHFSTLFREHTGKSFTIYLREKRIALAMELLGDPRINISEAAFRAGYEDPGYFARCFRRETGVTPSEWRAEHLLEAAH